MTKFIPLSQGFTAIIDAEDFERVSKFKWCASRESVRGLKWYAIRWVRVNGKRTKIRMHRFIMGLGTGFDDTRVVDHMNDDSLDNRKSNLRITIQRDNMHRCPGWKRKAVDTAL